jgi:molybdenum cofactor cytidylyltransferase
VVAWSIQSLDGVDEVFVVTGPDDARLRDALAGRVVRFIPNADRDAGMASSIRVGVEALPATADAVVIALGDQPFVAPSVTRALIERWRAGDADIVVPHYRDGRGHPVLFGRVCFAALRELAGDVGARGLVEGGLFRVHRVPVLADAPLDVDTPEALELAARRAPDDASM